MRAGGTTCRYLGSRCGEGWFRSVVCMETAVLHPFRQWKSIDALYTAVHTWHVEKETGALAERGSFSPTQTADALSLAKRVATLCMLDAFLSVVRCCLMRLVFLGETETFVFDGLGLALVSDGMLFFLNRWTPLCSTCLTRTQEESASAKSGAWASRYGSCERSLSCRSLIRSYSSA